MPSAIRLRKIAVNSLQLKWPPFGTTQWRVAQSLMALRAQADTAWPGRSKDSDGTIGDPSHMGRESDHNPWVKEGTLGIVTAFDLTHDPQSGCDANRIVQALVESRDARIKYLIWNRRIVSSTVAPWSWRDYTGTSPHDKHFHISVSANKTLYDDVKPWSLGN